MDEKRAKHWFMLRFRWDGARRWFFGSQRSSNRATREGWKRAKTISFPHCNSSAADGTDPPAVTGGLQSVLFRETSLSVGGNWHDGPPSRANPFRVRPRCAVRFILGCVKRTDWCSQQRGYFFVFLEGSDLWPRLNRLKTTPQPGEEQTRTIGTLWIIITFEHFVTSRHVNGWFEVWICPTCTQMERRSDACLWWTITPLHARCDPGSVRKTVRKGFCQTTKPPHTWNCCLNLVF